MLVALMMGGAAIASAAGAAFPAPEVELLGEVRLATGTTFEGVEVGGLSGITYDADRDLYYAVSDDRSAIAPARFFSIRIDLGEGRLSDGGVELVGVTTLLDEDGRPFARGMVDPEGIALAGSDSVYISSEGDTARLIPPFVRRFALDGSHQESLRLPEHYMPAPGGGLGIRANLGIEGLGMAPGWPTLFAGCESALLQDGPVSDLVGGSEARILEFDLKSRRAVREYVYTIAPVPEAPEPAGAFHVNGLSELLAVDGRLLVVVERSFSAGRGNVVRLYLVSLETATNVLGSRDLHDYDRSSLEVARKSLLFDLGDLGVQADNIEGITFGPRLPDGRRTLILISDNNFKPDVQSNQFLAFAVAGLEPVARDPVTIQEIQGRAHRSPLVDQWVDGVSGVVTAVRQDRRAGRFLWVQAAQGDGDSATSDGILVVTGSGAPPAAVGDEVAVSGRVEERGWKNELTVTRIAASSIEILGSGQPLPPVVRLGASGRAVPFRAIDDDGLAVFDPDQDAIDFFESLEGMRVEIVDSVVVGPTSQHGVITVLADRGEGSRPRTDRGGVLAVEDDLNPERVLIDDRLVSKPPDVRVGDRFEEPVAGVVDYSFGSFRVFNTEALPEAVSGALEPETTALVGHENRLTVASFNLENLSIATSRNRLDAIAGLIVAALASPDILAVQEVQDDTGRRDDGVVSCEGTLDGLVAAIEAAGGPRYQWRQIDPEDGRDGGQPGANIRVALLFNPERVDFVDRGGCAVAEVVAGPRLSCSPGRVAPQHPAFAGDPERGFHGTRKSLAGEFLVGGKRLIVINNHLTSKMGDDQPFGAIQPAGRGTERQRTEQTAQLRTLVDDVLEQDDQAWVIVLGDFNDFEYRPPMSTLAAGGLVNLMERLPRGDRYTYVFQGNAQALDHILVSPSLAGIAEVDVVHFSSELPVAERVSDHDAVVASFALD